MGNKLKPFKSGLFDKIPNIAHGFYGREGGVSDGIYASLNCGYGSNDSIEKVAQNRELVATNLVGQALKLNNPYQIHSDICVYTDKDLPEYTPRADAIVTDKKNVILAILTADCTPILFCDTKNGVIGAAHAGWKGAIGGIIPATLKKMTEYGAAIENITCAIGPCIEQKSYEVGTEFFDEFVKQDPENQQFFKSGKTEKYHFDLKGYCASILAKLGIKNIDILPNDTCAEEDAFFSNRRRNHAGEPDYGRNVSVIMLK
jgi:YfiH family protein